MKTETRTLLARLDDLALAEPPSPYPDIPCFQCGVCCVKWQPLLSPVEVRELAANLGMRTSAFSRRFTRVYPLRRGWRQLKATLDGCVFLRFDDKRSFCSIWAVRPQVCRDWQANLGKRECSDGLRQSSPEGLLTVEMLYTQPEDRRQFVESV